MKDFIEELMYMCSASNTKSRGLYIFIAIGLVALIIGVVVCAALLIINLIKGYFKISYLIITVVALLILIALVVWLKKS